MKYYILRLVSHLHKSILLYQSYGDAMFQAAVNRLSKGHTPEEDTCESIHRLLPDNTQKTEDIYMSNNNEVLTTP
jgi:hypothetical protein